MIDIEVGESTLYLTKAVKGMNGSDRYPKKPQSNVTYTVVASSSWLAQGLLG